MVCCDVLKSRKTELLVPNQTITTDHDTDHIRVLQRLRLLSAEVLVKVDSLVKTRFEEVPAI